MNEDIILNIRLNFFVILSKIFLYIPMNSMKNSSDYTYDDIYKYLLQTIANEDDQKNLRKNILKIKLMTISVLLPIFQLLNLGRNI